MHSYPHFQHYNYMRERRRERELRYLLAEQRTVHLAAAWKRVLGRLRALFEKPAAGIRQQPHTAMLRHWEFLRMLVNSGRLEV